MKLSIITINFNNKEGLQKTIDSVIVQTWRDFEWIIIDGGSTDGSKELIEQYQQHLAYWCSEPDKGVYNAMNKGIAKAKGEYLNFMNSGDVFYEKDTLMKVWNSNFSPDILYGDWVYAKKDVSQYIVAPSEATLAYFYVGNICHQAMFIKSIYLKSEGYDESFTIYADWARWVKMAYKGASFQRISLPICIYDGGGISSATMIPESVMNSELEKVRQQIPPHIRVCIERCAEYGKELSKYKESQLIQDIMQLIHERPVFCKLIHGNVIVLKGLRAILRCLSF